MLSIYKKWSKHNSYLFIYFKIPRSQCESPGGIRKLHMDGATVKRPHAQETQTLHQVPDLRTGEGVPLQHVPHKGPPLPHLQGAEPHRETGQDLVPEQEDEAEEDAGERGEREETTFASSLHRTTSPPTPSSSRVEGR